MATFSSEVAEIAKIDSSKSRVVLTNKDYNSTPVTSKVRGFSFIVRVAQVKF